MRALLALLLCAASVRASWLGADEDPIQPKARAVHILVKSEAEALELKAQLDESDDPAVLFGSLALKHSRCPTAKLKGTLGEWKRGKMVREFDELVFDAATPLRRVVGPVRTSSGWHLVRVTSRESADMLEHRRLGARIMANLASGEL